MQNRRLWARYADRRSEVAEHARIPAATAAALLYPSEANTPTPLDAASGERLLFHGADPATICAIVTGGFECRVSSMGGALGAGAYFAEHASYSNNYSKMPPHAQGPAGPRGAPVAPQPAWLRGVPAHLRAAALAQDAAAHGGAGAVPPPSADAETVREIIPVPGQLLMIVARVALGRTGQAAPQMRIAPHGFQSVGDNPRGRCQIYAVFANEQAYPEFVLQYDPALVAPGGAGAGVPGVIPAGMMPPVPGFAAGFGMPPGFAGSAVAMAAALAAAGYPRPKKRRGGR